MLNSYLGITQNRKGNASLQQQHNCQKTVLLCWEVSGTASFKSLRDALAGTLWTNRVCACFPEAWREAYLALHNQPAGSFSMQLSLHNLFSSLLSTLYNNEHTYITHQGNRGNTMHLILYHPILPEAKGRLLTLDIETGVFANCCMCGCLIQCCATPKPAFTNIRRIYLDLYWCDKKPVTLQYLGSASMTKKTRKFRQFSRS